MHDDQRRARGASRGTAQNGFRLGQLAEAGDVAPVVGMQVTSALPERLINFSRASAKRNPEGPARTLWTHHFVVAHSGLHV